MPISPVAEISGMLHDSLAKGRTPVIVLPPTAVPSPTALNDENASVFLRAFSMVR
jgi:hypothetical protein